ncbi:MAG: bifunctional oligoribonuclease/PAP phosphatase NrnA [Candidatus Omnitrophica bacterium]|nr:bifunctional oligoribonuclease/PAP phosphatase NrnA [Candidatus Omnitrophota bacterium]
MGLKKATACIRRNKRFLITAHTNLEGDALGSELGFYHLVRSMGKEAVIINEDSLPYGYEFMPQASVIKKFNKRLWGMKFDCFVILDCSDLKRCGDVARLASGAKTTLNIDHHISNEKFADINWVDPKASSCSELIYRLYKALDVPFDRDTATALYTGILADTGSFRYTNTTWVTHKIASELLKYGPDVSAIYRNVFENSLFSDLKLLAGILPTIKRDASGRIAWFEIENRMLKHRQLHLDLSERLLSFARSIKDIKVAVIFKENLKAKGEIRINFRSQGEVDVNRIASFFGGGGHKTASGATVKGKLKTVARKVLARIKEELK